MKIKFWGVRGSIPTPGPTTAKYGGNTTCIEVIGEQGECIILDAGTGIRSCGLSLLKKGFPLPEINIFISHTHWDHIQGFPFFAPAYIPDTTINVRGPVHFIESRTLKDIFDIQMQYDFFPISNQQLAANVTYESLIETQLNIGNITVRTQFANHPIRCLSYKIIENDHSIIYTGDHEPYFDLFNPTNDSDADTSEDDDLLFGQAASTVDDANKRFINFIQGTDLLIADCQYTPDEYPSVKRNWGHSSWDFCLDSMMKANAGKMILTHHDPSRSDDELDKILIKVREIARDNNIDPKHIMTAQENMEISI